MYVHMVQLNLNLTEHARSMGSTQHVFHFIQVQALCVYTKLMTSNLSFRDLLCAPDVCTIV